MKNYLKIPIIKTPKNPNNKITLDTKPKKIFKHNIIKLPLARAAKYLSTSKITNNSYKQNLTTNYTAVNTINTINNNTTSVINNNSSYLNNNIKNQLSKTRSQYHSPKNFFNPHKIDYDLIKTVNHILKQRSNEKIFLYSLRRNSKKEVINNIKEISLKNYHIDLLKKKRIDIDTKENYISQSLMQSSHKLEKDYKDFLNIVDTLKTEQKKDEEKLGQINNIYDTTLNELNKEINNNKKLNNNIVKIIKLISNCKTYGSFLYKIFDMTYPYEEIAELDNRLKISEDLREKVIKVYGKYDTVDISIFGDVQTLMNKYDEYEEKLINHLSNKERLIKEYNNMVIENKNELNILKEKIRIFNEDLNEATYKKKKLTELMINIFDLSKDEENDINYISNKQYIDEDLKACINSINEIGNCLEIENERVNNINDNTNSNYDFQNLKSCINCITEIGNCLEIQKGFNGVDNIDANENYDLQSLKEHIDLAKDIIKCLEEKEKLVNEYTTKISDIMKTGSYKDKQILLNLMAKMKRDNKFKNIINIKNKREELSNVKRLNAIKRSQKYVVKQKKIFIDVPFKNKQNKTKKIKIKENNEFEYLNYSSDDSNEDEDKKENN